MDKTQFDQPKQKVTTQYSVAGDAHFATPGAPDAQEVPTSSPSVSGYAAVGQQTGGIAAGTYIGVMNVHNTPSQVSDGQAHDVSLPVSLRGRLSRNVPTPSAVFTGREAELREVHEVLQAEDAALTLIPLALQGMGGVGKTQTAARYAHERRADYEGVFWVSGETPGGLQAQIASLAPELVPPVPMQPDHNAMFRAALDWFSAHGDWLLIVDNAEQLPVLKPLLPRHPTGRILLTTREPVPPSFGKCIPVEHLDDTTGAILLLRAAGVIASDAALDTVDAVMQAEAKQVSAELGGLPLALDQAGAYMQPEGLSPAEYLQRYHERGQKLHHRYPETDHKRVEVTFSLALERVQQLPDVGEAAAQLATFCAFLAPDAIPDEVFLTYPDVLPDPLAQFARSAIDFRDVWEAACRAALLRRETNPPGLSMHRLTQEVLRKRLKDDERRTMAERAVQAINGACSQPDFPMWSLYGRLLSHNFVCVQHIHEYSLYTPYAARLLANMGWYLQDCARYEEAEPLLELALAIRRQVHGEEHAQVATALNNIGLLYRDMGRYMEAAVCLEEAVALAFRTLRERDSGYASILDNLAGVYYLQQRYEEASEQRQKALDITRCALDSKHPHIAVRLSNLANVYINTGRYAEAEMLMKEAMAIDLLSIGQDHPDYATRLVNLAGLYIQWCRATEAAPLLTQALSIRKRAYGPEHPDVAHSYFWQGQMYYAQGSLTDAYAAYQDAWEIWERMLGAKHLDTANCRSWLDRIRRELAGEGV